jgi:hypothetical protein
LEHIRIVKGFKKLKKICIINKKVELKSLKYFHFEFNKFDVVDSSSNLKSLVVVVHFIVEFGSQNQTGKEELMNVKPSEGKITGIEIVLVDVDQCQDETFGFESSLPVNAVDINFEVDVFEKL